MLNVLQYIEILNNPERVKEMDVDNIKYIARKLNINILNIIDDRKYKDVMTEDIIIRIMDMDEIDYIEKFIKLDKVTINSLTEIIDYLIYCFKTNKFQYFIDIGYDEIILNFMEKTDHIKFKKVIEKLYKLNNNRILDIIIILKDLNKKNRLVIKEKYINNYHKNYTYVVNQCITTESINYDGRLRKDELNDPYMYFNYDRFWNINKEKKDKDNNMNKALNQLNKGRDIKSIRFNTKGKNHRSKNLTRRGVELVYEN